MVRDITFDVRSSFVRAFERLTWRVRIALENRAENAQHQLRIASLRYSDALWGHPRFEAFVDRVAGDFDNGYPHITLRRWLYDLRFARWTVRIGFARLRAWLLRDWLKSPGRYEYSGSSIKAAWFDDHAEYASASTGDTETIGYHQLFVALPWAPDGAAIVTTDASGFVSFVEYATEPPAQAAFGALERVYSEAYTEGNEECWD